jgi:hypothetical protein
MLKRNPSCDFARKFNGAAAPVSPAIRSLFLLGHYPHAPQRRLLEQRPCAGNGLLKDLAARLDAPYQINTFVSPSAPPATAVEM